MAPDAATQMERRTHREDQTNAATMLALLLYRRLISSHIKKQEHSTNVSILISSEPMQIWGRDLFLDKKDHILVGLNIVGH